MQQKCDACKKEFRKWWKNRDVSFPNIPEFAAKAVWNAAWNNSTLLKASHVIGCCDEIIAAVDALGCAIKGKWPPMLRKHYENAINAAKLLRKGAV